MFWVPWQNVERVATKRAIGRMAKRAFAWNCFMEVITVISLRLEVARSAFFLRVPLIQSLRICKSRSSKISNYDMFIIRTIVRDTNNTRILMIAARGCQGKM